MPNDLARPLPAYAFMVTFDGVDATAAMYFKSLSGLKYEQETLPTPSGGTNDRVFNLVGQGKWSNIVLTRGFTHATGGSALLSFREAWMYPGQGGRAAARSRTDGTISQLDSTFTKVVSWKFHRAWPVKWSLSDYDATKSELAIETLELAHDGIEFLG